MVTEDLVNYMAKRYGIRKAEAGDMVSSLLADIKAGLKTDGVVCLAHLGRLKTKRAVAYRSVNPQKPGEYVDVPSKLRVTFVAATRLKKELNT